MRWSGAGRVAASSPWQNTQATNSPTQKIGSATPIDSTPLCAPIAHAIAITPAATGARHQSRAYQPRPCRPSKTTTNDSRYSVSGRIHRNGIDAMFCVMWFVTASSSIEPSAPQTSQNADRRTVGRRMAASSTAAASTAGADASAARSRRRSAHAAHATANAP